jgi:ABC-2 type transport system permease protein
VIGPVSPVKALAIARANFVRTARDRQGLFFIVLLPMILIIVLGTTYGGQGSERVGVADADGGPFARELVADIAASKEARIEIRSFGSVADLRDAVSRGFVEFGLSIPAGYDAALRSGGTASVEYVATPTTASGAVRSTVERAVAARSALVRASRFAAARNAVSFDDALAAARTAESAAPGVSVAVESVATSPTANVSGFSLGAQSQVILFMFLTALTGAVELIATRQLGISRRMLSTPTSVGTIILGEGIGRVGLALFQGGFIVIASALLFNVNWADPLATAAIILVFSLVAGGAAMLIGATAANASQAGAIGPALGMLLGLFGGTMVPPEVFPEAMRTASHLTPHAWAMDAFRGLLLRGETVFDILPQLGVLVGFAVVLLALAVWRFRRALVGAG